MPIWDFQNFALKVMYNVGLHFENSHGMFDLHAWLLGRTRSTVAKPWTPPH